MDIASMSPMAQAANDAHDDVKDVAMTAWQHKHDEEMQERQFGYNKALNSQMAGLARDARQMSASDQVVGLRAAGLNPALAQGGQFGSVSSGGSVGAPSSGGSVSPHGSLGNLALESIKYAQSERDLMASQATKNRAEAEAARASIGPKDIEYENLKAEFAMTNGLIQDWIDRHLESEDPDEKATAQFMRDQNEAYGVGALKALNAWMQFNADQKKRAADMAKDEFEKTLYDLRNQNDVARVIYDLPKHERNALISDIARVNQEIVNMRSNKELTDTQISEVRAHYEELSARAAKVYHTDPVALMENDDWKKLVMYYGDKLLDGTLHVGGGAAAGAAAGKMLKGSNVNVGPQFSDNPFTPVPINIKTPMQQLGY